jgi:hypothetical protein
MFGPAITQSYLSQNFGKGNTIRLTDNLELRCACEYEVRVTISLKIKDTRTFIHLYIIRHKYQIILHLKTRMPCFQKLEVPSPLLHHLRFRIRSRCVARHMRKAKFAQTAGSAYSDTNKKPNQVTNLRITSKCAITSFSDSSTGVYVAAIPTTCLTNVDCVLE